MPKHRDKRMESERKRKTEVHREQVGPVTSSKYLQLESQESRNNRSEALFKEIMIENLPKLKQTVKPQIYKLLYISAEKNNKRRGKGKKEKE